MKYVIYEKDRGSKDWELRLGRYKDHTAALDAIETLKTQFPDKRFRAVPQESRFAATSPLSGGSSE